MKQIHSTAVIEEGAIIQEGVVIGPHCFVDTGAVMLLHQFCESLFCHGCFLFV